MNFEMKSCILFFSWVKLVSSPLKCNWSNQFFSKHSLNIIKTTVWGRPKGCIRTLIDCSSSFICLLFFICFVFLQSSIYIVWNVRVIMLECHVLTQWACSHCFSICFPPGLPWLYIFWPWANPFLVTAQFVLHCTILSPLLLWI